jgi:hypothetical protein
LQSSYTQEWAFINRGEDATIIVVAGGTQMTNLLSAIIGNNRFSSADRGFVLGIDNRTSSSSSNKYVFYTARRAPTSNGLTTDHTQNDAWPAVRLNILDVQYSITTNIATTNRVVVRTNNGTPQRINTLNFAPDTTTTLGYPIYIGMEPSGLYPMQDFKIAQVMIYRRHLSAGERTQLYDWIAGKTGWSE